MIRAESYIEINLSILPPSEYRTLFPGEPIPAMFTYDAGFNLVSWIQSLMQIEQQCAKKALDPFQEISKFIISKHEPVQFSPSLLESINETGLVEDDIIVSIVKPLSLTCCLLYVTNLNFYLQPVGESEIQVERFKLRSIKKVFTRRYNLKDRALEIFTKDDHSHFISFDTHFIRNDVLKIIKERNPDVITQESVGEFTQQWMAKDITNAEYVMKLNELAHRSFNDLSQYPVFPWILSDYSSEELDLANPDSFRDLSKPVGALNPQRLQEFKQRLEQSPDPKQQFLYGTHYSAPLYVISYLVRKHPLYMLHTNSGRFDSQARLFNSVGDDWRVP